jgi:N-carbamoyl-L-amino-acid hydrolase
MGAAASRGVLLRVRATGTLTMLVRNARAQRGEYSNPLREIMNIDTARENRRWLAAWPCLNDGATPLHEVPALARRLGIAQLCVKDESLRSPLGSFKPLGAPVALVRFILRSRPHQSFTHGALLAGRHAEALRDLVVISASDGNHGRALAAAARSIGCQCVIVLHEKVSAEREAAIAALGARIVRVRYEDIPRDVMQGYATIADEVAEQRDSPFTHVFLQGGVGGLAAGVVSYFQERLGSRRPTFIVVEPAAADCLYQSAISGRASRAKGSADSVMAGLACGTASPLAWRFLERAVDFFCTVEDEWVAPAMRLLAEGSAEDIPIVAGESGAAGLAALMQIAGAPALRAEIGLDAGARVLLINTEGDTAPAIYTGLAGRSGDAVRAARAAWLCGRNAQEV